MHSFPCYCPLSLLASLSWRLCAWMSTSFFVTAPVSIHLSACACACACACGCGCVALTCGLLHKGSTSLLNSLWLSLSLPLFSACLSLACLTTPWLSLSCLSLLGSLSLSLGCLSSSCLTGLQINCLPLSCACHSLPCYFPHSTHTAHSNTGILAAYMRDNKQSTESFSARTHGRS